MDFYVGGMTCINCQTRIEKQLKQTPGVSEAQVDYRTGRASVAYDPEQVAWPALKKSITDLGYDAWQGSVGAADLKRSVLFLLLILALYFALDRLGILTSLAPSRLAENGMGYGMLFLVGLATSIHCIAMCGGINLSQSIPSGMTLQKTTWQTLLPAALYNLGRILSYTAVGFLLGLIGMLAGGGGSLGISPILQGALKLLAGLLMVLMGVNMLGIFPWLRGFSLRLPRLFGRIPDGRFQGRARPFFVGLLNGLMPCGPLQAIQILALASGHPLTGALSMLMFSLGTVPLMLGLGSVVSLLGRRFSRIVRLVGGVIIVVMGLAMLAQGGSLSGWIAPQWLFYLVCGLFLVGFVASLPLSRRALRIGATALSAVAVAAALWTLSGSVAEQNKWPEGVYVENGVQYVTSTLGRGVYPSITVVQGLPLVWTIEAPRGSVTTCNYKMLLTAFDRVCDLEIGENVIEFTPTEVGDFTYTCWMGMIWGNVQVVENPDGV